MKCEKEPGFWFIATFLLFFVFMVGVAVYDVVKWLRQPEISPEEFIGDRVVHIDRVAFNGSFILTSRDGKIVETRDFKNYRWIQR